MLDQLGAADLVLFGQAARACRAAVAALGVPQEEESQEEWSTGEGTEGPSSGWRGPRRGRRCP